MQAGGYAEEDGERRGGQTQSPRGKGAGKRRPVTFDSVGIFGKLLFTWVNPVISMCMQHSVRPEELPPLGTSDDVRYWSDRMDQSLADEEKYAAAGKRKPSVIRAVWRVLRRMLFWIFIGYVIRDGLGVVNTYFLKRLLQQDVNDADGLYRTVVMGSLISLVQLLQIFVDTSIDFYTCRVYMRVEMCLLTSLFKKVIQPDAAAPPALILREAYHEDALELAAQNDGVGCTREEADSTREVKRKAGEKTRGFQGNVFNLMFVDIPSLASLVFTFVDVVMMPVRIGFAAGMLYMQIGAAAEVPGLIIVLLITAVTTILEIMNANMKTKYMLYRDIRLDKSHEALSSMRTIRLLGWEDIAEFNIKRFRDLEMHQRTLRMYISAVSTWLSSSAAMAMSMATFMAYTLPVIHMPRFHLRPELAIPVIHLLDNFIGPITDFPYAVNSVLEGYISLARIQNCFFPPVPPSAAAARGGKTSGDSHAGGERDTLPTVSLSPGAAAEDGEDSPLLSPVMDGAAKDTCGRPGLRVSPGVQRAAAEMLEALQTDPAVEVIFASATFTWMPHASSPFLPPPPFPPSIPLSRRREEGGQPRRRAGASLHAPLLLLPPASDGLPTLYNLSFRLRRGDLLLLTGPPGCGKSSVFHALLQQRELQLVEGSMFVKAALGVALRGGSVAGPEGAEAALTTDDTPPIGYIAQEPWLQIGTIKENIVFNQTADEELYRRVVEACELHLDFESWPGGDSRFIDEGGADLSGGQRMRITMARAIYVSLAYRARAKAQAAYVATQLTQRRRELSEDLHLIVRAGAEAKRKQAARNAETPERGGSPVESGEAGEAGGTQGPPGSVDELSHLLCFDETFNSLDPYVAGRIFMNLFGPEGLLVDAAVIVGASEQSLSGLVDQLNGADKTPRDQGAPPASSHPSSSEEKKMKVSVGCLEEGRLAWLGSAEAFWTRVHEGTPDGVSSVSPGHAADERVELEDRERAVTRSGEGEETIEGMLRGLELETRASAPQDAAADMTAVDDMLKNLMVNEQAASGQVKLVSYGWYLRRVGLFVSVLLVLLHLLTAGTDFTSDLWIARWTGKRPSGRSPEASKAGNTEHAVEGPGSVRGEEKKITEAEKQAARALFDNQTDVHKSQQPESRLGSFSNAFYLWFYVAVAGLNIVFELTMKLTSAKGSLASAELIHNRLLNVICTAPFWFYDQNPMGRILNRLSTDVAVVDAGIFKRMSLVLAAALSCAFGLGVLAWTTFWAVPLLPVLLLCVYFFVFRYYRATCREVQRASLISFSPLCSSFSECLSGRDTIFALRRKRVVCERNLDQVENSQRAKILHWGSSSWASIRLQLLTFPLAVLNAIVPRAVAYAQVHSAVSTAARASAAGASMAHAGYLGLALSYSLSVASSLRRLLIHYAHLEKEMCSVERVHEYIACTDKMSPDSVAVVEESARLPSDPSDGPAAGPRPSRRASDRAASQNSPAFPFLPIQRKGVQLTGVEVRYRRPGFHYVTHLRELLQARLTERCGDDARKKSETHEDGALLPLLRGHPATEKERDRQIRWLQKAVDDLGKGDEAIFLAPSIFQLSADVGPSQHVGIVGRTGSGKSTLLQALNGLVPCYRGTILLDGTRIDCLPKQVLKQVIGVLPQNPITFKGMTVREVLDPRYQHTDAELWAAMDEVGISSLIQLLPGGKQLDTVVSPDDSVPPESAGACRGDSKSRLVLPQGSARRRSSVRSTGSGPSGESRWHVSSSETEDVVSSHPLSDVQLRYLAVARLVLRAASYRLILVDEPPAETLDQLHRGGAANACGTRQASGEAADGAWRRQSTGAQAPFVPIPQLIRRVFAHCTVFIVAHHVASLQTCDTVWLMWKGRKIGECTPAEIRTDKQLAEVMMRQVNRWKQQCTDELLETEGS